MMQPYLQSPRLKRLRLSADSRTLSPSWLQLLSQLANVEEMYLDVASTASTLLRHRRVADDGISTLFPRLISLTVAKSTAEHLKALYPVLAERLTLQEVSPIQELEFKGWPRESPPPVMKPFETIIRNVSFSLARR